MKSELVVNKGVVYHLGLKKNQLARNILLVGDPARAHKVAAYFDVIAHETLKREYVTITGDFMGLPVSVIGTGIGTDNVEIALAEIYTISIGLIFNSILQIVFSLIGMFYLSPTLAMGALFLVPIIFIWVKLFSSAINKIAFEKTEKNSLMVGKINEIINGITVLKIFNSSKKTLNDFSDLNDELLLELILDSYNLVVKSLTKKISKIIFFCLNREKIELINFGKIFWLL